MREWKPGDVAMVTYREGTECVSVLTDRQDLAPLWIAGSERAIWARDGEQVSARPLVVIDPDDRVQIERLRDEFDRQVIVQNGDPRPQDVTPGQRGNALQAALRSLVTPPKPDEPTGLGAVVEDADGRRWYRTADVSSGTSDESPCAVWKRDNTNRPQETKVFSYRDIAAVKILSDGVQP